jgi:hypothetical protein
LQEHDTINAIECAPSGAYCPVTAFRHPAVGVAGAVSGAVVVPPHADVPGLWLAARRNQLFVHPLPGSRVRGFAPLNAPCCEQGFFWTLAGDERGDSDCAGVQASRCRGPSSRAGGLRYSRACPFGAVASEENPANFSNAPSRRDGGCSGV